MWEQDGIILFCKNCETCQSVQKRFVLFCFVLSQQKRPKFHCCVFSGPPLFFSLSPQVDLQKETLINFLSLEVGFVLFFYTSFIEISSELIKEADV